MDTNIIVVGAGAAGLMAARELARAGKRVTILEARDRIGGRIFPLPEKDFGYEAQGGAEFVHGEAPISRELLAAAGVKLQHGVEWWDVRDGEPELIQIGSHSDEMSSYDSLLIAKLEELKRDMPVKEFLETYFGGPEYEKLRAITIQRIEGYDAADPVRASAWALLEEMTDESAWQQHSLKEGYGALLRFFEDELRLLDVDIILEKVVTNITMREGVKIGCADGSVHQAQKVLVTVPLPLIETIQFDPPQEAKRGAAGLIGYGAVIKILLRFKSKWWAVPEREKDFQNMFFMFSHEAIPTWWTQYPEPHFVLTGWLAGPLAERMSAQSDEDILAHALESLCNIFKISREELQGELLASKVNNWQKDPFARGGYSYATPESVAAIEELSTPVAGKIFFAGEALGVEGITSTVESALWSGTDAAHKILADNN
ncbi:MAG TPA: NAD(P)/FAD-dependent oxidoreductase [Candidatus Paceibacterota bacterium]|nr:NAD(P)/FAD-dependent oxidoreductase [Candidatus Paceibacterota bacterium]